MTDRRAWAVIVAAGQRALDIVFVARGNAKPCDIDQQILAFARGRRRERAWLQRDDLFSERFSNRNPGQSGTHQDQTRNILVYRALIESLSFSTAAASSFMVLISLSGLRPAFSTVCACTERSPPTSMISCWASRLRLNDWNNFAAFGLGEPLKMPFGPMISGEPSVA